MRTFKKQCCFNSILDLGFSLQQAQVRCLPLAALRTVRSREWCHALQTVQGSLPCLAGGKLCLPFRQGFFCCCHYALAHCALDNRLNSLNPCVTLPAVRHRRRCG